MISCYTNFRNHFFLSNNSLAQKYFTCSKFILPEDKLTSNSISSSYALCLRLASGPFWYKRIRGSVGDFFALMIMVAIHCKQTTSKIYSRSELLWFLKAGSITWALSPAEMLLYRLWGGTASIWVCYSKVERLKNLSPDLRSFFSDSLKGCENLNHDHFGYNPIFCGLYL